MSIASIPARLRAEARSTTSLTEDESALSKLITNELLDIKSPKLWRGAVAELLGTALLCMFTIGMGVMTQQQREAEGGLALLKGAIGSGFFLAALISALSNVSGAHVNPAISVGFLVTRQISFVRCLVYCLFQTAGAIAGTGLLKVMVPSDLIGNLGLISPGQGVTAYEALGMEILVTFFLMFVVLSLVDPGRDDLAGSVPLLVGLTVACNILFAANISGACMNPARGFGPAILLGMFNNHWVYWAGPVAGSILGSLTYDWFFSTSPVEVNSLKKLAGKDDFKRQNSISYGTKDIEKDLQIDDENEEDEEVTKSLLKEKLRRERTNGVPKELERRESLEYRRSSSLKEKFPYGSGGQISIKEEDGRSAASLNLGNLENAQESKV